MIDRLNGRTSVVIAVVGLLLVVLVGWLGFVSPQRSKAADLAAEISDTETQLAVTQTLVEGPLLSRSKAELATLRTAIPDELQMSQLLRQLSKAAADGQVRILGITPQPVSKVGVADVVLMSVMVEGRYFAIRQFLRLLRSRADIKANKVHATGRLFAIDAIQFAGSNRESGGMIAATLTVTAFAFSQPVAVPSTTPYGSSSGVAGAELGSEVSSR